MSLLMQFQIYKQLELIHLTPNEIKIYHMILGMIIHEKQMDNILPVLMSAAFASWAQSPF